MRTPVARRLVLASLALTAALVVRSVVGDAPPPPPLPAAVPRTTGPAPDRAVPAPLVVGHFALGDDPVTDGDTFRLPEGAPARSVRVQCVDAEEVWHKGEEGDRAAALQDFDAYCKAKRGESKRPVKFGTPAGEAAKAFAKEFLKGVRSMRLERDEPGRDHFIFNCFKHWQWYAGCCVHFSIRAAFRYNPVNPFYIFMLLIKTKIKLYH